MNLFSAQHSYRLGSESRIDGYFESLRQFVKHFNGSEPQYFYFEQKENGEADVSNWRFGVVFRIGEHKVQIKQPNAKDWNNRFLTKVDNGDWTDGNKISTVDYIEKSVGGNMKRKVLKNNRTATELFQAIKDVCLEYGMECPDNVWDSFYQDMARAINPSFFGETAERQSREKIREFDEGRSETKYRFASRQIKNSVENDWRQVAHNLYPNVWKYWFSDVAKEANKGNGFNRQTFDYGVQMIVERGGRDSSDENQFFLHFSNAYYTAQREGKLKEFLDNLYEDISNMAKYEGYRVTNSRKIESAKEEDCGKDACVLTPFGEIDRTVANADFTDESFEAYVVEPYAEESDGMFVTELETKGE